MPTWKSFLDSLDTHGGHILVLLLMLWVSLGMGKIHLPESHDLIVGTFAALLAKASGKYMANGRGPGAGKVEDANPPK